MSAFPAVELLWDHADSVVVRMGLYHQRRTAGSRGPAKPSGASTPSDPAASPGAARRLANFLAGTRRTDRLEATVGTFQSGRLTLTDVRLTKRGRRLQASGVLTAAALQAALPTPFDLHPVGGSADQLLFQASAKVFGHRVSANARLRARHGGLVIQPDIAGLIPSFLAVTVFSDPRFAVSSFGAQPISGGWRVSATATLTGG